MIAKAWFGTALWLPASLAGPYRWPSGAQGCTLTPTQGSRKAVLPNGVIAETTWSACSHLVQDFVFEWTVKQGRTMTSKQALRRAAELLTAWRRAVRSTASVQNSFDYASGQSPFSDLVKAIERCQAKPEPYVLGETFPVTDNPDWDRASVSVTSTARRTRLTIHYWANP